MRVLMPVLHYYPVIGGLETWTQNIAEGIALRHGSRLRQACLPDRQGFGGQAGQAEIFVVTARVGDSAKYEVKNGVIILRTSLFSLKDLSHSPLFHVLTTLPFIFLRSFFLILFQKINLLHCQGFLGSCIGYCLSKITSTPYIVTVQRLEEKSFFKIVVYKNAKVCIAASFAIKKYFEEIGCRNIEVIPNGVDLRRFESLKRKPHQGFVVMTVARLEKVKGVEYLIKAFDLLMSDPAKVCAESDLQLLIIGDGSERKNLESLVKKLGLEDKARFVGQIPPEGIPEYLDMADCFVLPSLKEGFGIAVLEAMAAGVPVVASRVGGILDILEHEKTGLLAEPANSQQIADAIRKIYQDSGLGEKLINNAMAGLKRYDWQNIAERVFKIYENCIRYGNISA